MNQDLVIIIIATLLLVVINFIATLPVRLKYALNIIIILGIIIYLLIKLF